MPDDSGVANQSSPEMPDLTGGFNKNVRNALVGSGESLSGDIKFSDLDAPMPDDSGVTDRPRGCWTSEVTLIRKPERSCRGPVNRSLGIFSSRIWIMDALMPNASGVANQSPSEMPYLAGDFNKTTGMPLSGSGDLRRPMGLSGCNALRGSYITTNLERIRKYLFQDSLNLFL